MYRIGIRIFFLSFVCVALYSLFSRADYLDRVKLLFNKAELMSNPEKAHIVGHGTATVRVGNDLSEGERSYIKARKPKVCNALEKIVGRSLSHDQCPIISVVMSGGGYRAMLGAIGFLSGAEKCGILDTVTYISALSGSTWAVAPWIVTGMSLPQFKSYITDQIVDDINDISAKESHLITKMLFQKIQFKQPITTVDLYGGLIANRLLKKFGNRCQNVTLSDLDERIKNGDYPYPIFTAIDARSGVAHNAPWFEFTPHEIGSADFGLYIPTWSYGRRFNAGASVDSAPEQSLGFQLGTYGSAFGVHVGLAWDYVASEISDLSTRDLIKKMIAPHLGKRLFWASVPNYMLGIKDQEWSERSDLKLVDAALAFNLPYPPVSGRRVERKPDILFFCDMSAFGLADVLKSVENYARTHNLKFPVIDYDDIHTRVISVFRDTTDSSIPVVMYMPRLSDQQLLNKESAEIASQYGDLNGFNIDECIEKSFCKTGNFQYTSEQSNKIIDLMEFNVLASKKLILDTIKSVVDGKSNR